MRGGTRVFIRVNSLDERAVAEVNSDEQCSATVSNLKKVTDTDAEDQEANKISQE